MNSKIRNFIIENWNWLIPIGLVLVIVFIDNGLSLGLIIAVAFFSFWVHINLFVELWDKILGVQNSPGKPWLFVGLSAIVNATLTIAVAWEVAAVMVVIGFIISVIYLVNLMKWLK